MVYMRLFSVIFFIFLIVDIYAEINENWTISWMVKPLLMPILLMILCFNEQKIRSLEQIFIVIALGFSCLGDILLLQHEKHLFVFGLASFLVTHICYIISFILRINRSKRRLTISALMILSIPFLVYIALMISIFHPKLSMDTEETKGLLVPVIVYTCVIVGMAYVSHLHDRKREGYWWLFIGAILFVLSDTFLALNRFLAPIPMPGLLVMSTYGIGQYLITIGTIKMSGKQSKTL